MKYILTVIGEAFFLIGSVVVIFVVASIFAGVSQ
jgi:hypothetical protein